jgi:two-component system chemotaxis sensor kinase CheA
VASVQGQGSTFTLYLPLDYRPSGDAMGTMAGPQATQPAEDPLAPVSNEDAKAMALQANEALAGRKVLVVDDDIRNVFAMTSALETRSMRVLHAESGKEGIDTLKRERDVDLILMDVMMPGLDGLDTIRIIRSLDGYRGVPIVAVTAKAMVGDREKCIEAGANDYIAKPVNVDVLLATAWRALQAAHA